MAPRNGYDAITRDTPSLIPTGADPDTFVPGPEGTPTSSPACCGVFLVDSHGSSPWAEGPRAKPGHERRARLSAAWYKLIGQYCWQFRRLYCGRMAELIRRRKDK